MLWVSSVVSEIGIWGCVMREKGGWSPPSRGDTHPVSGIMWRDSDQQMPLGWGDLEGSSLGDVCIKTVDGFRIGNIMMGRDAIRLIFI